MRKPRKPRAPRKARVSKQIEQARAANASGEALSEVLLRSLTANAGELDLGFTRGMRSPETLVEDAIRWVSPKDATVDHLDLHAAALMRLAFAAVSDLAAALVRVDPQPESPIEWLMFYALVLGAQQPFSDIHVGTANIGGWQGHGLNLTIQPQAQIGDYRVDFLLTYRYEGTRYWRFLGEVEAKLAVECDGHNFHERTKEQASRDKARDRALQSVGIPVFRYTGSDIWRDAFGAALECLKFLQDRGEELARTKPSNPKWGEAARRHLAAEAFDKMQAMLAPKAGEEP